MVIISDLKNAKRGAIAKAISIFENDKSESRKLIKKIFKTSGKSVIIGITGPAGAGKSSLIDKTVIKLISSCAAALTSLVLSESRKGG